MGERAIAVFGHRPYVGVSANIAAAAQLPGWDEHAVTQRALGTEPTAADLLPFGEPQRAGGTRGSVAKAVVTARSLGLLRHLRADTQTYVAAAAAEHLDADDLAALPDAGLEVRLRLLRDRIQQGWILTGLWVIDTGVTAATLEHTRAGSSVTGIGMIMESGRIAAETAALAAVLRATRRCAGWPAKATSAVSVRCLRPPLPPWMPRWSNSDIAAAGKLNWPARPSVTTRGCC